MRSLRCNHCKTFSPVTDWDYGCPACGYSNQTGEMVRVSEYPGCLVMDDIPEFKSPSGVVIRGRKQWRNHLAATDTIEMGHSDVKVTQAMWNKRQEKQFARVKDAGAVVDNFNGETPKQMDAPIRRSNLAVEMANRLHGRPTPDRKTMIKLTLDEMKRINRGR